MLLETQERGDSCYVVEDMFHRVIQKVENVPNEVAGLARESSNQSVECATWFFLIIIVKSEKQKRK